jgi:hypothetical protein
VPQDDPTGIGTDRGVVDRIEDDTAVLLVGPGGTPIHVGVADLPDGAAVGTWVVLDVQFSPPFVVAIDEELTAARPEGR